MNFKYGAEAFALLGLAYAMIKWVGRSLRSFVSDSSVEQNRLEAMNASAPAVGADMLVRQGIVSAKELDAMSPRERAFLIANAGGKLHGAPPPPLAAPPRSDRPRATPAQVAVVAPTPPAGPRLHLITPTRPPLGVAVHCPGCGAPLDRDALQRFGEAQCGRCKRPVSAHLQKGRLTVIIEETPEEGEYRRRLENR
jgi:hypothetical protein